MAKNNYLNEISNFPESVKLEFMAVVKKNLTSFFLKLESALKSNDISAIKKLTHKVTPILVMLDLESFNLFLIHVGNLTNIDSGVLLGLLDQLELEKKLVETKGWM